MILSYCNSLSPLLSQFDEVNCHIVIFPMERPMWQVIEGDLRPTTRKELMPTVKNPLGTEFCKQSCE